MKWVLKSWCFWTVVLEKTLESALNCKEIKPVNTKGNQSWIFIARTDAEAEAPVVWPPDAKMLTHWKRPWCWERLKAGGKGDDDRGWDSWRASRTRWTRVWASSRSCWWTGKPGMLQFMGLKRVEQDWATELKDKVTCLRATCPEVCCCSVLSDSFRHNGLQHPSLPVHSRILAHFLDF